MEYIHTYMYIFISTFIIYLKKMIENVLEWIGVQMVNY